MSNQQPVDGAVDDETSEGRLAGLVALCLLVIGAIVITTGVMLTFSVPVGLIVLGVLLLGAGIMLGLE